MHQHPTHCATTDNAATAAEQTRPLVTSTVMAVVLRVAGPVETGVIAHGLGHPERQASVRIGDAVIHLRVPNVAALVRQRWDGALGSALRLRERVSQTWLRPRPDTYPAAVSVQLTDQTEVFHRFMPADPTRRQPPAQPAQLPRRWASLRWERSISPHCSARCRIRPGLECDGSVGGWCDAR
jgi:hypothetical protein